MKIIPVLDKICRERNAKCYDKPTFGCTALAEDLKKRYEDHEIASVELIGLCTDICVVSNALIIKSVFPDARVKVDPACCAGVTVESHEAALKTMAMCQVEVG